MELFEQQYFIEQYIILTRTEDGHKLEGQVLNDIRTANVHNDLVNLYNRNISVHLYLSR